MTSISVNMNLFINPNPAKTNKFRTHIQARSLRSMDHTLCKGQKNCLFALCYRFSSGVLLAAKLVNPVQFPRDNVNLSATKIGLFHTHEPFNSEVQLGVGSGEV